MKNTDVFSLIITGFEYSVTSMLAVISLHVTLLCILSGCMVNNCTKYTFAIIENNYIHYIR